jgi:hypothetical protein
MKIKTSKLIGVQLDWAVAKCVNADYGMVRTYQDNRGNWHATLQGVCGIYSPSTSEAQGGPLVDEYRISVLAGKKAWWATKDLYGGTAESKGESGGTRLLAAMRCLVASELGDEVEIPEELK